ncbi:MAG: hypothetical protein WC654_01460 [Patescibacteria group bacterium]
MDSETPSDTVALNTTEGTTYENTRFGYRFIVPDGALVYALNLEGQTARLAEPQDEIVFVVGDGSNVLTIRGIDGEVSSHQWLTDHVTFFYPTGEAAQQIQELDGRQALALYGDGSSGSPARILVVQNGEQLIVITFEQEAEVFDRILTSFSFIL